MSVSEAIEAQLVFSPLLRLYTLEEFWALREPSDRSHYDLIGGALFMVPPPDPPHGEVDSRLNRSLVRFLDAHDNPGDVYHPREAIFSESTSVEPDMMYVSKELPRRMRKRRASADIGFEYLSKSMAVYDRTTKADTYLALGVSELWLIDPTTKTIELRHRIAPVSTDALPKWEAVVFGAGEVAVSRVLTGWRVSVDELFAELE